MNEETQNKKDKRRGLISTAVFHLALLIMFLFLGLTYYEPKPEDGIIINFGNSETGLGNEADGAQSISSAVPQQQQQQTQQEEVEETDNAEDPVMTQENTEAPSLDTKPNKTEKPKEPVKTEPTPEELERQRIEKERLEKQRKLDEQFGKVSSSKSGGEGVTQSGGDQGDHNGDPNSPNRTGGNSGGGGGSGNYMLGNRQALTKPAPDPCPNNSDEGRVVVKIYVDQQGNVTRAIPGEKVPGGAATTTTSSCLFDKAKGAAMRTKWQADSDAPSLQIGYIIYNFVKN